MAPRTTLLTKLACSTLVVIIINVSLLITVIALISKNEMCKSVLKTRHGESHGTKLQRPASSLASLATTITEHPWMTSFLVLPDHIFLGSAAIISSTWALTTANSIYKSYVYPITKKGFRGGSTFWNKDGFYHFAVKLIPHENYDPKTFEYNIALVKVSRPFTNPHESPIPIGNFDIQSLPSRNAEIIGWVLLNNTDYVLHLHRSLVELIPVHNCNAVLHGPGQNVTVFSTSICAINKESYFNELACLFTTGSSLVQNNKLIGLASWGATCNANEQPSTYVYLPAFIYWVERVRKQKASPVKV